MKKLLDVSLLAMLCCVALLSFAQQDTISGKGQRLKELNMDRQKFDIEEDIRLMTLLTNALEKDGLINKKSSYKLEIKDASFYINDNKQSKEVRDKYRKYFRVDSTDHYTIHNNGDRSESSSNHQEKNRGKPDNKPETRSPDPCNSIPMFDSHTWKENQKLMTLLINGLDKEGLLDSRKPYTLEVRAGELHINGNKQSKAVSDKFRKYFQSNHYALIND